MYVSTALLCLLVTCINAASETAGCYDYVIVSTGGTNEPQGPSIAFVGMINSAFSEVPRGTEHDTVYPAGYRTEHLGAVAISHHINQSLSACPQQNYVLLGYSQGTASVVIALENITDPESDTYKAIKAVVIVGNLFREGWQSVNVDEFNSTSNRGCYGFFWDGDTAVVPDIWYHNTKLIDKCHTHDMFCEGEGHHSTVADHLKCGSTPAVQHIGSQWMTQRLKQPSGDVYEMEL